MEIKLEAMDQVRQRTGADYSDIKAALERTKGNVIEAIVLIEKRSSSGHFNEDILRMDFDEMEKQTIEELKFWLKQIIDSGNVARIRVIKDETELVDVPVNAGIAAGVIATVITPILVFGVVAAIATKVTIEITMLDGSVKVVNKYISKAVGEAKSGAINLVKRFTNLSGKNEYSSYKYNNESSEKKGERFIYTVNFEEVE